MRDKRRGEQSSSPTSNRSPRSVANAEAAGYLQVIALILTIWTMIVPPVYAHGIGKALGEGPLGSRPSTTPLVTSDTPWVSVGECTITDPLPPEGEVPSVETLKPGTYCEVINGRVLTKQYYLKLAWFMNTDNGNYEVAGTVEVVAPPTSPDDDYHLKFYNEFGGGAAIQSENESVLGLAQTIYYDLEPGGRLIIFGPPLNQIGVATDGLMYAVGPTR